MYPQLEPTLVLEFIQGVLAWAVLSIIISGVTTEIKLGELFKPLPYPHEDGDEWCVCTQCLRDRKEK